MDLMDYRRKIIANSPHLSHAEGAVASFSDGADNIPLKSLIVNIDPVQSGTGDPSPDNVRPISGWDSVKLTKCRKNLLPLNIWSGFSYNKSAGQVFSPTLSDKSWTQKTNSISYTTSSTYTALSLMTPLLPAGDYYISMWKVSSGKMRATKYVLDTSMTVKEAQAASNVVNGWHQLVTLDSEGYIAFYLDNGSEASQTVEIQFQVTVGNTESAYEPYTEQTIQVYWRRINQWDEEWETGTFNTSTGEPQAIDQYWRSKNRIPVTPLQTYYFHTSTDSIWRFMYGKDGTYIGYLSGIADASWEIPSNVYYINIVDTKRGSYSPSEYPVSINYPSTEHDYHPYNGNYLHINQWDEEWRNGYYQPSTGMYVQNGNYICNKNMIPVLPSTSYYFKTNGNQWEIYEYDASGEYLRQLRSAIVDSTFTTSADARFINIGSHTQATVYNFDISVNYPSADTSYHPYNEFIVYGGTRNVLTGELTVDRAMVDLGTLNWGYSGTIFYTSSAPLFGSNGLALLDGGAYGYNSICEIYKNGVVPLSNPVDMQFQVANSITAPVLRVADSRYTDAAAYKSAMSGVMAVFKLRTPITYQLDPQTVRSLYGQNNIFSDTGNVALEYWAHP